MPTRQGLGNFTLRTEATAQDPRTLIEALATNTVGANKMRLRESYPTGLAPWQSHVC